MVNTFAMVAALVLATAVLVLASPAASHPYNNVADFRYGPPAPRHWQAPRNGRGYKAWDYQKPRHLAPRRPAAEPFWCVGQKRAGCM